MNDTKERIERGAAWLDRTDPTWLDRVNLAQLNLADSCGCVMGQVVSRYHKPSAWAHHGGRPINYFDVVTHAEVKDLRTTLPRGSKRFAMTHDEAVNRGFHASSVDVGGNGEWGPLSNGWKKLIKARRAARA